ncbi:MAG: ABC transporter ATP-binding protein [Dehalococcoidia bacterium]|nr:ABC transporter ATP-binding protein [Dehalococcoidia bacterium]
MDTSVKALIVDNLSKNFGGLLALDRVSLQLEPGERRALIGPNGAGKTTLFHLISGALSSSEGRIHLFGNDATNMPIHRRAALGLARTFQITNLFSNLTLKKNLLLAAQGLTRTKFSLLRPMSSYKSMHSRVDELLETWDLGNEADTVVRNLSYGTQRRVEILLALIQQPKLLLLDEPTGGLSPAETVAASNMIRRLPEDITVLLIEHDMDVALDLVQSVTVLHLGQVLADGPRDAVKADARVQEIYLGTQET